MAEPQGPLGTVMFGSVLVAYGVFLATAILKLPIIVIGALLVLGGLVGLASKR